MKNSLLKLFFLFVVFTSLIINQACTKKIVIDKQYFSVDGAELIKAKFPSARSDVKIQSFDANGVVIPGGTNPITLTPSDHADYVIIGVKDEYGYYQLPATYDANGNIYFVLIMTQELVNEDFTILIALKKGDNAGEAVEIPVRVVEVGTGKFQVSLSWDKPNDVDLHLIEPDGTEIYYGSTRSENTGGELDLDSNPDCDIDGVNNENITYGDDAVIPTGKYIVKVDFYSNCSVNENTHYVVSAYLDGDLIPSSSAANPYNGQFAPDEVDYGGAGAGDTVMTINITSAKTIKAYKFAIPHIGQKKVLPKGSMRR